MITEKRFMTTEIEESRLYRINVESENITVELEHMGFKQCTGVMSSYNEIYADVVRLKEILDTSVAIDEEVNVALVELCETVKDGTICFYGNWDIVRENDVIANSAEPQGELYVQEGDDRFPFLTKMYYRR